MADNTARQIDSEAGQGQQAQLLLQDPGVVPINRRAQRHRRRDSNTFFFGIPEAYGPTTTYPNAFRFQAGSEIYQLVGSGPGGRMTQDEQRTAGRAMEALGMPIEELNLE
ncbi:hypothetical protein ACHAPE_002620 [Trichoderma viride]